MFTKFASIENAEVITVKGSGEKVSNAQLSKISDYDDFRTDDQYLYARIRAISSRVNKNHDGWPSIELAGGQEIFDKHAGTKTADSKYRLWGPNGEKLVECAECGNQQSPDKEVCEKCGHPIPDERLRAHSKTGAFTASVDKEASYGYSTFLGKPIFVDHNNSDPSRARGVIVDAKLHVEDQKTASLDPYYAGNDVNPLHVPPTWVELLLEVDAKSFPKFAQAIIEGGKDSTQGIDGFSMGANVERTECNICKNSATTPDEFCEHVRNKGALFDYHDPETGQKTSKRAYEDCFGVQFFEISGVFDPADETALVREVVASTKTASLQDYVWIGQNGESCCSGHAGQSLQAYIEGEAYDDLGNGILEIQTPMDNWMGFPSGKSCEYCEREISDLPETEHPLGPQTGSFENPSDYDLPPEGDDDRNRKVCSVCEGEGGKCIRCDGAGYLYDPSHTRTEQIFRDIGSLPETDHPLGKEGALHEDPNPKKKKGQGRVACPECEGRGFDRNLDDCTFCKGNVLKGGPEARPSSPGGDGGASPQLLDTEDFTHRPIKREKGEVKRLGKVADYSPEALEHGAGGGDPDEGWGGEEPRSFPETDPEVVQAVKAYALEHYQEGWDTIVEAYTDEELGNYIDELGGANTAEEAVALIGKYEGIANSVREEERGHAVNSISPNEKMAANDEPQSELIHVPDEVDTLRKERICDICGSNMDSEQCDVCGYIEPPEGFDNPDLGKAKDSEVNEEVNPEPEGLPSNPPTTAHVNSDMSWKISMPSRVAETIVTPSKGPASDEPEEEIINDPSKPVTSSVRTAADFIAAAGANKGDTMKRNADAASGAPAVATPDTNVDVDGVGGVQDASNEESSTPYINTSVDGIGGVGESVDADSTVSVDQGDQYSKNIEAIPTKTFGQGGSAVERQADPVSSTPFPTTASAGWRIEALDSGAFPRTEDSAAGGGASQGTGPSDPMGNAQDRVDLTQTVTSPANNSGPTKTWSGTDGNGVTRQQEPTTNDTLEGADGVKSARLMTAFKLADLEIDLGLLDKEQKYARVEELQGQSTDAVNSALAYAGKVKTAGLAKKSPKTASRFPSMGRGASVVESNTPKGVTPDEALFS
jgi:hypothetical protein